MGIVLNRPTELSLTDVLRHMDIEGAPGSIGFTPDGRRVVYLKSAEGSLVRSLFALDPGTGEESILAAARSRSSTTFTSLPSA